MTKRISVVRQVVVAGLLLVAVAAIAAGGSLATAPNVDGWYADADKVPWNPPGWVFGPAWTVLYLLIAISGFLIWRRVAAAGRAWDRSLALFVGQLALNAAWTPVFFAGYPVMGEAAWWAALVIMAALIACVVVIIVREIRRARTAALLFVPYLAWLVFAATLNVGIIALN